MKNKFLAGLLSLTLALGAMPVGVWAAPDDSLGIENPIVLSEENIEENADTSSINNTDSGLNSDSSIGSESVSSSESVDAESSITPDEAGESTDSNQPASETNNNKNKDKKNKKKKSDLVLPAPGTVTGFPLMSQEDSLITLNEHVSMEELEEQMPETMLVYLDYSSEAVEIPVIWVSEIDYETTDEGYYIFWADWDKEMFPLAAGYGYEDYLPFVEVVMNRPMLMSLYSEGVENILARARQMVDIRWTPLQNLNGFFSSTDPLTVYSADTTYNGIPYGQQVYSGTWVPNTTSFDTFLNAVDNPSSPLYLSRGSYGDMNSTYYANDCSSFVSYCYGLPRMTTWSIGSSSQFSRVAGNSIYNAEEGDCFNMAGAHVEIITGMNYDENGNLATVEITEQTPPKARTVLYTPTQAQRLINQGYTLLRFKGRDSVETPQNYNGYDSDRCYPVKIDYNTEADSELTLTDRNGDGTIYDLRITGLQMYSRTDYEAAIWSRENGQDDLKWIKLTRQSDASYTATVRISDFKHRGFFYLHLYKSNKDEKICLKRTDFDTEARTGSGSESGSGENTEEPAVPAQVKVESISLENVNNDAGTCRILMSGVTCADGVSKIEVPTWSAPKQADIVWYQARKLDATTWYVDFSIAKHQNNYGTYQIHVYGTNRKGVRNFCERTTATFTQPEATLTAKVEGTEVTLQASGLSLPAGIQSVVIPTWSNEGGQDDLTWVNASYNPTDKSASAVIDAENYKHFGLFISHLYATDRNGKMVCLAKTSFTVNEPQYTSNEISCSYNEETGAFSVTIAHPKAADGKVDSVVVPTWSGKSQEDIIWYEAAAKAGDKWVISGNIKDHIGVGIYNCHVYGRVGGRLVFLGKTDFTAAIKTAEPKVGGTSDGISYPITVNSLKTPVTLRQVQAAVWSEKNGQDDLVWYTLKASGGQTGVMAGQTVNLSGAIDMTKHKTTGVYNVHLYGMTAAGKYNFIQKMTITLDSNAETAFQLDDAVPGDGKVELTIRIENSDWPIDSVTVPTWCSPDQSDIVWYKAAKAADGSWKVTIDKKNHKEHTGTYQVHTYCDFSNGTFGFVGKTTAVVE